MRESRTYGFVRGVLGDQHPYRDSQNYNLQPPACFVYSIVDHKTAASIPNIALVL
jgi:hypothetical protein